MKNLMKLAVAFTLTIFTALSYASAMEEAGGQSCISVAAGHQLAEKLGSCTADNTSEATVYFCEIGGARSAFIYYFDGECKSVYANLDF